MGRRLLHLHHRRKPPLNYFIGSESYTITPFDPCVIFVDSLNSCIDVVRSPMYLFGYVPAHNRVYLVDKDVNVYSYSLSLSMIECKLRSSGRYGGRHRRSYLPFQQRTGTGLQRSWKAEGRGTVACKGSVMSVVTPTCSPSSRHSPWPPLLKPRWPSALATSPPASCPLHPQPSTLLKAPSSPSSKPAFAQI